MLTASPCRGISLPRVEPEEMRFLNPAAIRRPYRALVLVGAYGGLRIGELAGLRRSRVDLDAGTVDVAENVPRSRASFTAGHRRPGPAGAG
jgi:integrase